MILPESVAKSSFIYLVSDILIETFAGFQFIRVFNPLLHHFATLGWEGVRFRARPPQADMLEDLCQTALDALIGEPEDRPLDCERN